MELSLARTGDTPLLGRGLLGWGLLRLLLVELGLLLLLVNLGLAVGIPLMPERPAHGSSGQRCRGCGQKVLRDEPVLVEENRRKAICMAMELAQKDDILVLCGKGHETYQIIGTEKTHLDEREEVAAALREQKGR